MGELLKPLVKPFTHLPRSFFGEGNRQDFLRLYLTTVGVTFKQRPQHARHQHPGFARTGAGLNRHAATRIAGDGVKGFGGYWLAIVFVGGLVHITTVLNKFDAFTSCQQGPRNRLCRAAGAAAPSGGRESHEVNDRGGIISRSLCGKGPGPHNIRRLCLHPAQGVEPLAIFAPCHSGCRQSVHRADPRFLAGYRCGSALSHPD